MTNKKPKLELTWIGKENRPKLEPRILIEDAEKSYGDPKTENMLIHGDNLLALKALEQEYAGKIKCVFIDPPYNTGSAFEHYDDGIEHSIWLSLMRDRLEIIQRLLSDDGSLWITIDDNEAHYLKVMCDEVFGRKNFIANVVWQKKYAKQNDAQWLSTSHDHVLIYGKNAELWHPNKVPRDEKQLRGYINPDNDHRGPWQSVVYTCAKSRNERPNLYYAIIHPKTGQEIWPSESRVWAYDKARHLQHIAEERVWWGLANDKDKPRLKSFLGEVGDGVVPDTLWLREQAGDNQDSKREGMALFGSDAFATPKPEKLMQQIITISTMPNDLVLDSFLGSGTTAAVAHKMGRKWIGIELGEHCQTHCIPRLQKVVDGTDQGGISVTRKTQEVISLCKNCKEVLCEECKEKIGSNDKGGAIVWKGGGGFKFYNLAPSLLKKDKYDNFVIDEHYNADMLAAAMAKHEGFRYHPDKELYWKQGQSTERDFIFTTTQFVTVKLLDQIQQEMKPEESLLICCKSFQKACEQKFPNITIKKIPKMLLGRCEFGKNDYSLNIISMPQDLNAPEFVPTGPAKKPEPVPKKRKPIPSQIALLD